MQTRIIRSFDFIAKHNSVASVGTDPDNSPDFSKEVLYELNNDVESIAGIHIFSNRRDLVFGFGQAGFTMDGKELMPDNCGAAFFMCGGAVPGLQKFFMFRDAEEALTPEPAGNGQFRIRYADNGSNAVPAATYTVTVALLLNLIG